MQKLDVGIKLCQSDRLEKEIMKLPPSPPPKKNFRNFNQKKTVHLPENIPGTKIIEVPFQLLDLKRQSAKHSGAQETEEGFRRPSLIKALVENDMGMMVSMVVFVLDINTICRTVTN